MSPATAIESMSTPTQVPLRIQFSCRVKEERQAGEVGHQMRIRVYVTPHTC